MDKVPISTSIRWQRDIGQCLRSLSPRWLSSDPIQIGALSLPLRPVVGLLTMALALAGIGAVWSDGPDASQGASEGAASVLLSPYPNSIGSYPSARAGLGGYQTIPGAEASLNGSGAGSGYPTQLPAPAPHLASTVFNGNGNHSGYAAGDDRSFAGRSQETWRSHREAGPAPAVYQGFRFREETVAANRMSAYWAKLDGYRFRPLNDQELERMQSAAAPSRLVPDVGARSLYDELSGSYGGGVGWQSAPARPDYPRTW